MVKNIIFARMFDRKAVPWRTLVLIIVPLALLPLVLCIETKESKCGYVISIMAIYFMTEPLPLAVTALIPVVLFPLLGVLTTAETCTPYMKDTIMMYVGGLTIAAAVEHCNLHKRIALKVLLTIGTGVRWLMLGFMITTMFLSMWISNTATTAMMVPIVEAVMDELRKHAENEKCFRSKDENVVLNIPTQNRKESVNTIAIIPNTLVQSSEDSPTNRKEINYKTLNKALLLSVAYAANCGGTGSLIGSGPNLVLKGFMEDTYPKSIELTFASWLFYNAPAMIVCVILSWIILQIMFVGCCTTTDKDAQNVIKNVIQKSYKELGSISFHEIAVLSLFTILVFLWFLREPQFITGWSSLFPYGSGIRDATPAIAVCLFLFVIPAKPSSMKTSPSLLDWKTAQKKIPWGILLLLGSGFTVAEASKKSGLSTWLGSQLIYLRSLSPQVVLLILVFVTSALTEIVSNMSITTIVLPVINEMAVAISIHPLYFLLPVTIVCSFAFMLPVGNPSNAIIFDSGAMTSFDMMKAGVLLKFLCCAIEFAFINTLGSYLFYFDTFPSWANETRSSIYFSMSTLTNSTSSLS
ncbi:Na(+)/citrate cotransporter-like [Centruroides vittatus]|uniref:Na(+)/citrate cotransporter-like n=1 Tax=Centruroides vittatus TaxID=120091 RepID=UPI003510CF23